MTNHWGGVEPVLAGIGDEPLPPLLRTGQVGRRAHHHPLTSGTAPEMRGWSAPEMGRRSSPEMGELSAPKMGGRSAPEMGGGTARQMGGGQVWPQAAGGRHLPGAVVRGGEVVQQVVQVVDVLLDGLLRVGGRRRVLVPAEKYKNK